MTVIAFLIFCLSIILSAIFCIRAKYKKLRNQLLIFKPVTLILIIIIAVIFPAIELNYKILIISGLLFSLLGDIFLIYPEQHFKKGLLAFLAGHFCYIFAFSVSGGFHFTLWIFLPIVIVGILYLRIILPYSAEMKIPIIIYVMIIMVMGWMAIERLNSAPTLGTILAATGAILFMISDTVLALNKFKKSFFSAELIILTTYYTAQWLLAVSIIVT